MLQDDNPYMSPSQPNPWSPLLAARVPSHAFFEDDSNLHHHSGSEYPRDHDSYGFLSGDPCNSNDFSLNDARSSRDYTPQNSSRRPLSHISVSSDDPGANNIELIRLQSKNAKLKLDVQNLRGRMVTLSYVLNHSIFYVLHWMYANPKSTRDSYNNLLNTLGQKINETRDNVRNMVQHISTKFVRPIPGAHKMNIPLNSRPEEFTRVKYWDPNVWNDARHRSKATNVETSVFSSWMEDEFSRDIPDAIRSNLRDNANSYWTDMYTKGKIPKPWGSTGFERKENFWIIMEGKYPWLRLCNGHWKA